MDDYAVITLEGGTLAGDWYIAKTLVPYLTQDLGNSGSSTINLYRSTDTSGGSYSREYISISSLGSPVYHPVSGNSSYITGYTVSDWSLSAQVYRYSNLYDLILIFLLGFLALMKVVRGK